MSGRGLFLQTDPILFQAGDVNIYRYVGNNGVNGRDPMGLWQVTVGGGAGLGGGVTFGKNGGQWNFGGYAGAGEGAYADFDPSDSGSHTPGFTPGVKGTGGIGLGENISGEANIGGDGSNASIGTNVGPFNGGFGTDGFNSSYGLGAGGFVGIGGVGYFPPEDTTPLPQGPCSQ